MMPEEPGNVVVNDVGPRDGLPRPKSSPSSAAARCVSTIGAGSTPSQ